MGALGLKTFNHPWQFQSSYAVIPPALVLLGLYQYLEEYSTSQFRLLILVMPCQVQAHWLSLVPAFEKTFLISTL